MGTAIYGVTLIGPSPWTAEQKEAVQRASREVLQALMSEQTPSDQEVVAYWQRRLEEPYSVHVYGQLCPQTAYWQLYDDDPEHDLLRAALERHCRPAGMTITSHASY